MKLSDFSLQQAFHQDTAGGALKEADVSLESVREAQAFHTQFLQGSVVSAERGVHTVPEHPWAAKMLRRASVPEAVIEKLGSTSFCKRRPENTAPFLAYVQRQYEQLLPLTFRIPFGPLKNMNRCGTEQLPDIAEYLTMIQLARMADALAGLYPHGIKVQLVPDDHRARKANMCPEEYTGTYIAGLQHMAKALGFDQWLHIENGEAALYEAYGVEEFMEAAQDDIQKWKDNDPESFNARWQVALDSAEKNFPAPLKREQPDAIAQSAWRYLVAHQAEILSGMWSTQDACPLVMANHKGNFQLFSLGTKKTKLPWQIALPVDLLKGTELEPSLAHVFPAKRKCQIDMGTVYAQAMLATP